jgi:hypothetical protein
MRMVLVGLAILLSFTFVTTSRAEHRRFLVANDADGYGIDRCLASGEKCGSAAANAYCRTREFAVAASYHKVGHGDVTAATVEDPSGNCMNGRCNVVAIICLR